VRDAPTARFEVGEPFVDDLLELWIKLVRIGVVLISDELPLLVGQTFKVLISNLPRSARAHERSLPKQHGWRKRQLDSDALRDGMVE
jgi:hypothetical protein